MSNVAALAAQTSKRLMDVWFKGYIPGEPLIFERFSFWYMGTKDLDDLLRNEFEQDVERALIDPEFRENMKSTGEGSVALTILLDQIPRNIFRGSPRPFVEFDPLAREVAKEALSKQTCANVHPFFKHFLYMPLEHSENLEDQAASVRGFTREYEQAEPPFKDMFKQCLTYAVKHEAVIKKFGRFPHRNAVLGRASTEAEKIHLETGGDRW